MNSFDRVMTTLIHKEPDRVPVFLFMPLHGAKELNLPLSAYFSKAENIIDGQLRLLSKYNHDCLYPFFYASKEVEAFGGSTIFYRDGPPNAGKPIIQTSADIHNLACPNPNESESLKEPLRAIRLLSKENKGKTPIISAVIAPFSLPSMLMGLENWLDLILFGEKEDVQCMLKVCKSFCVSWANAQFEAGLDAVAFFDPLATSDIMTREQFLKYDFALASDTIKEIKGPVVYAGAGGRIESIADLIPKTGAFGMVVSAKDNLKAVKDAVGDKINIVGNLNNVEMPSWTPKKAEQIVHKCIADAAKGGGYILADQHGELPYYVEDTILRKIVESARKFGQYEKTS
jgi:uroporphyrinogen decarboxylase